MSLDLTQLSGFPSSIDQDLSEESYNELLGMSSNPEVMSCPLLQEDSQEGDFEIGVDTHQDMNIPVEMETGANCGNHVIP